MRAGLLLGGAIVCSGLSLPAYGWELPAYPMEAAPGTLPTPTGTDQPSITSLRQLRVSVGDGAGNDASPTHPISINLGKVGAAAVSLGQAAMAASIPVVLASDQSNLPVSVTVNSAITGVQIQPASVQAAAYSSGNTIGGLLQFTAPAQKSILQNLSVTFASGILPPMHLVMWNANPSGSTVTDKTAITQAVADLGKLIGYIPIGACIAVGTPAICQASQLQTPIPLASGTTLYAALVLDAAATLTSADTTTKPFITMGFLQ